MLAKGDCLPNRKNEKALERNSKLWDLKLLNSVMVTQRNNFKKLKKKTLTVFSSGFNFKIKFITKTNYTNCVLYCKSLRLSFISIHFIYTAQVM